VSPGLQAARLAALGVATTSLPLTDPLRFDVPDASLDALAFIWSGFRGVDGAALAEADRVLRPGGRLLVVHDYGRDDVSRLREPNLPEYTSWSRRDGPFLRGGFKLRVLHCFWTFESLESMQAFLGEAFGPAGEALAVTLKRPRLSWNVALYHRWRDGIAPGPSDDGAVASAAVPPPMVAGPLP
jgi:SAM-dependent methyltransferase